MEAGKLRHRITLQQETVVKDVNFIETATWVAVTEMSNISAAVEPISGREYFQAAAIGAENTIKVTIRYRSGVTAQMRVLYGSRILNIRSVIDFEERHREIHLMCQEVVSGN